MKDILLINNKAKGTGIGSYSFSLFSHLQKLTRRSIDFITLNSSAQEDGSVIKDFPQSVKKLMDHLYFVRKIPRSYKVYHLLNPNLGIILPRLHPSVVTVHDISVLRPNVSKDIVANSYGMEIPLLWGMQLNMSFIRDADRILCLSYHTRSDLISVLGIESKRVVVSYPGIDHQLFKPRDRLKARQSLDLPINKRIILHIGTDEPRKNTKTLIDALYLLRKRFPDVVLVKIGGLRDATRRLISARQLEDSIRYYRKVPSVAPYYNAADLFVFPSYYEGFGYPAAEAMASGCPVVAADSSSVTEVVGKGGIIFPPFDVVTLSESISQVLTDSSTNAAIIEEGLEQVKKFDWKKCAETTLRTYETL